MLFHCLPVIGNCNTIVKYRKGERFEEAKNWHNEWERFVLCRFQFIIRDFSVISVMGYHSNCHLNFETIASTWH